MQAETYQTSLTKTITATQICLVRIFEISGSGLLGARRLRQTVWDCELLPIHDFDNLEPAWKSD